MQINIAFTSLCFLAFIAPAWAHAHLLHANPAAGEILKTAPAQITLHFSEALEGAFSSITVTDEKGTPMNAAPSTADGTAMHMALKKLAPGRYHVHWVSVAIDTHRLTGDFDFSVAP